MQYTCDEDETRKQITAAFRGGVNLFVFDEAHVLEGASLARALTAITYTDRILGVSTMAEFPNRVTWISLGNQVQVNGDLGRRVYRIAIRPTVANPHDRDQDEFRHPDLRGWTRQHRAALLTAALTLVRAWFVAGQPAPQRGVSFGSFESWQRTVGGITDHAGQPGFLDNLHQWRCESDFSRAYWSAHLAWLRHTFGPSEFKVSQVVDRLRADPLAEHPPGLDDPSLKGYPRLLGQAYAKQQDRHLDGLRLSKNGTGHNNTLKWRVYADEDHQTTSPTTRPAGPAARPRAHTEEGPGTGGDGEGPPKLSPEPLVGGKGVRGVTPSPALHARGTTHTRNAHTHIFSRAQDTAEVTSLTPLPPAAVTVEPLLHLAVDRPPRTCRECGGPCAPVPPANFWFACPVCFPITFTRD